MSASDTGDSTREARAASPSSLAITDPDDFLADQVQEMRRLERARADLQEQCGRLDVTDAHVAASLSMDPEEYSAAIRRGNRGRSLLVVKHLPLVAAMARRYAESGEAYSGMSSAGLFGDLMQEGSIGLMEAATRFDPRRGFKFSTYATYWIRNSVQKALSRQSRTIAMPQAFTTEQGALRRAEEQLRDDFGREPTAEEIATAAKLTVPRVLLLRSQLALPALSMSVQKGDGGEVGDSIVAPAVPDDAVDDIRLRETLSRLLGTLAPQEAEVLRLRFGLIGGAMATTPIKAGEDADTGAEKGHFAVGKESGDMAAREALSVTATARAMGVSKTRVLQLEAKGVASLRQAMEDRTPALWRELQERTAAAAVADASASGVRRDLSGYDGAAAMRDSGARRGASGYSKPETREGVSPRRQLMGGPGFEYIEEDWEGKPAPGELAVPRGQDVGR